MTRQFYSKWSMQYPHSHIGIHMRKTICPRMTWLNKIHYHNLKRINTNYPKWSVLFKVIHAISSFSYWHSYVEDDMSMDSLDWINSIIIYLKRININYPKSSVLFKVIHAISSFSYWHSYVENDMSMDSLHSVQYPLSHIGTHMWKTICPWIPCIE